MAHIMDGSTGTAHISSKDWATFNAATYGLESGVFDWGDRFKLTMSSANKGTVGTGAALVAGRRVWIETPENVTVTNGGQGVKRNDIVGLQYETYSDGAKTREKATLKVIKGTPAPSSPADPEKPANFLPLWRVPLDGLNVGDPVPMFPRIPSVSGIGDAAGHLSMARTRRGTANCAHGGALTVDDNGADGRKATRCRVHGSVWWNEPNALWDNAVRVPGLAQDFYACKTSVHIDVPTQARELENGGLWIETKDNPNGALWFWGLTTLAAFIGSDGYLYIKKQAERPQWAFGFAYVDILIEA